MKAGMGIIDSHMFNEYWRQRCHHGVVGPMSPCQKPCNNVKRSIVSRSDFRTVHWCPCQTKHEVEAAYIAIEYKHTSKEPRIQ